MTPTHTDVIVAIEQAREFTYRAEHCDDLRAIMQHHPMYQTPNDAWCDVPLTSLSEDGCGVQWPCPTVQVVIDRLQSWGTAPKGPTDEGHHLLPREDQRQSQAR